MGTAFLFLLLLDAIILSGAFGAARVDIAIVVSVVVLVLIGVIWMRNLKLEKLPPLKSKGAVGKGSNQEEK